jgi:AcrR family transcriptional regulator
MSDPRATRTFNADELIDAGARPPLQERSQQRVALALEAAERLLESLGPEQTSIPEIAKESGVPRASLYQFYPSKYALFAHLAQIHLRRVEQVVATAFLKTTSRDWKALTSLLINEVADYYDRTPVASMLILGGPFSRSSYLAQEAAIGRIAQSIRAFVRQLDPPLMLPENPDVATLIVEISFACMKHGYYRENRISQAIREQAAKAVIAYLKSWEMPAN